MAVATRNFFLDRGSDQSVLEVLSGLRESTSTSPEGVDCHGMLALWATMVGTSQS